MASDGHMDFYESRGWGIGVEWIGRCNGDCVAVGGVDSIDGYGRNEIWHGGLTRYGIHALTINNRSVNHKENVQTSCSILW